jgi:hypothetical protein
VESAGSIGLSIEAAGAALARDRLEIAVIVQPARGLPAPLEVELSKQVMNVGLGGGKTDVEPTGDILVAQAAGDQLRDLPLAGGQ